MSPRPSVEQRIRRDSRGLWALRLMGSLGKGYTARTREQLVELLRKKGLL